MAKLRVGILFGGKSAEHEVSLQSARNIIQAMDPVRYEVIPLAIAKTGQWYLNHQAQALLHGTLPALPAPQETALLNLNWSEKALDVVFPVLHGPLGEDGTVQGLLKLANVPFVGSGVLGSAVGMDKDVMKRLLRDAHLPVGRFLVFRQRDLPQLQFETLAASLGSPFFVKPANLGSSVGVHRVEDASQCQAALRDAFSYDHKILVEANIPGREIECAVLGNEDPRASVPGEVIPSHDFYSYAAKYLDEKGARLEIPARLSPLVTARVQELAIATFEVLGCEGLARVDFFVQADGAVFVNEINTLPGFTAISMYPKLWEASGISYPDLIDQLIQLARERFTRDQKLQTSFGP
ncbi:D-alanine--D-alanine ligase [Candidatus Cyanaurora vandensis]|uniref:D-alanine--D-alanine ligase n=1 Tax=Candidatus Cyanaurora vandensis TaxID=2714958 RepID=UPI00257B0EB4|nr:D-alanine--D-alanine ligase [Candidatus Cyanaurora vandensis]